MINQEETDEVLIFKQITRDYIINNPALAAQQKGQERDLRALFGQLLGGSTNTLPSYLPRRLHYLWEYSGGSPARFTADCIAGQRQRVLIA